MKSLVAGIVLIIVIGLAGFVYRNVMERTGGPEPVACTMEAKICPDGSAVGRTGPSCAFAPCLPPNIEIPDAAISFVVPPGYVADAEHSDAATVQLFAKPSASESVPHFIAVQRYPIPAGKTAEDVMVQNTRRLTADMPIESMDEFKPVLINGKTFHSFVADRFEAQVVSYYYLPRPTDVLRFEVTERDVTDWMNADLVESNLPEHQALLKMLSTLQTP